MLRNTGSEPVTLDEVRVFSCGSLWFSPSEAADSENTAIPADGKWHEIIFDLNSIYADNIEAGIVFSNSVLKKVTGVSFVFSGTDSSLEMDALRFSPETDSASTVKLTDSHESFSSFLEKIVTVFKVIICFIRSIFVK